MSKHKLCAIDLFSGAGGLTLAARNVGYDVLAAIEINKHAILTYHSNFVDGKDNPVLLIEKDINKIEPIELLDNISIFPGDCDLLMGGPPCQGFSTHRIKDAGIDDIRNQLLIKYFDFIDCLAPKAFIVENVTGLLWNRHKKYLDLFLKMANENYKIYGPTILNARDFGVPQSRKRVFIIGIRKNINCNLEWPPIQTHFNPKSENVKLMGLPEWVNASYVFYEPIPNDENARHMSHSETLVKVFENTKMNRIESGRVLPCHKNHNGHRDTYGRIDLNKPGPTMTTACVNPSKGRFLHPIENHGITLRHAARFQTFPDSFIFKGGLMASSAQIGNAVPIKLGEVILKVIADTIHCHKYNV